ncbi:hypothetical protein B0T17DRAFT_520259 [Bombardia bombarda]|uniref:Uncharacterized protein n=1 Tax=Bombardia bombarda TaxID=252184 RepID=A0AA40CH03_9PEZI|nr:hypothetical protein B0T17DRAFT_520259 [Bombardia bombarda]
MILIEIRRPPSLLNLDRSLPTNILAGVGVSCGGDTVPFSIMRLLNLFVSHGSYLILASKQYQ